MNEKAELLFTEIWWRTNRRFSDVFSFRRYTILALPHVKKTADLEYTTFAQSLAYDENNEKFFIDKKGFFESVGSVENLSDVYRAMGQLTSNVKVWMVNVARGTFQLDRLQFEALNPRFLLAALKSNHRKKSD